MKKFLGFLVMFLFVVCLVGCGEDKYTIKIGSSGPLSGGASIYGQAVKKGVELAIEEINKEGIKIGEETYTFKLVDFINDEAAADKAAAALSTLVDEGADVIVGAVTSGATEGLIGKAITEGIPVITPTGTADKLTVGENGTERAERSNVFRACFYDSYQGSYMAEYAAEAGKKTAYVLYNNSDAYSVGLKDAFVAKATEKEMTVITQGYEGTTTDFASFVAPIVAGNYDCVYLPDYYQNVYNILSTLYGAGYEGATYGGDGWDGVVQQVKEGESVAFLDKCIYTNHFFSGSSNETVKKFVDAYKAKYDGEVPVSFAALGYDAVYIVKQAIEAAQSFEYDAVVKALAEGTFTGLVTSATEFKFDANGNPTKAVQYIGFKDGKEVEAK